MASKHILFDYFDRAPDVELDFGDEIYLLHSDALKSGSRWFEKSLSDRWSQWRKDGESDFRYYYRVELDIDGDPYLASTSKVSARRLNSVVAVSKFLGH